jgi:hypothetical protein
VSESVSESVSKKKPTVTQNLADMDLAYLECRDPGIRHRWERLAWFRSDHGVITRQQRCERCGTEKTEKFTSRGNKVFTGNRYTYAKGYLVKKGAPRIFANDVRGELIKRAVIYDTEDSMRLALGL